MVEKDDSRKTDFSFFPEERERVIIACSSAEEMAQHMEKQPRMIPSFLHELWRNSREEEMYQAMKGVEKDLLLDALIGNHMVSSLGVAHAMCGEPIGVFRDFLRTTLTLAEKAVNDILPNEPFEDEDILKEIDKIVEALIQTTNNVTISYKARNN